MKTMKKNAREHNINEVIQELIAARLHLGNEESLKKKIKKKTKKIAIKRTEQNKKN